MSGSDALRSEIDGNDVTFSTEVRAALEGVNFIANHMKEEDTKRSVSISGEKHESELLVKIRTITLGGADGALRRPKRPHIAINLV